MANPSTASRVAYASTSSNARTGPGNSSTTGCGTAALARLATGSNDSTALTKTPEATAADTMRHRCRGGRPSGNTRHKATNPARFHTHAPSWTACMSCAAGQGSAVATVWPQSSTAKTAAGAAPTQASAAPTGVAGARQLSRHPVTTGTASSPAVRTNSAGESTCGAPNASAACTAQAAPNTSGGSTAAIRTLNATATTASSPGAARMSSVPARNRWYVPHSSAGRDVPGTSIRPR